VLAGVLVLAAAGGVYAATRPDNGTAHDTAPRVTPTPTVSLTPTPTPTPTRTPTPTHTAKPLPRVTPAAPRRLVASGLFDVGFDSTVSPKNGVFTAGSTAEVARWGARGVPGSPAKDTVYVIGKVSTGGAFAKLAKLHRGSRVTLRTQNGVLTYTVHSVVGKPAKGLTADATFRERRAGRLQLVGIRYDSRGDRTGTMIIVTAQLTGARTGN